MQLTAEAIMRRAGLVMLATTAWIALGACVTLHTPDAVRDTIHGRHTDCLRRVEAFEHGHGLEALAVFRCDADSERECIAAGLEHHCDQWQSGGL